MTDTKKTIKAQTDMKALEKAIGGNIEENEEAEKTYVLKAKEEPKEEPEEVEEVKEESKEETFASKSAQAAATAALKAAIETNSEIAMKEAEKTYFLEKKNNMLKRCKEDRVVTRTISKLYAQYLGKVYSFMFNGIVITIYCDDKPHEYPEFIAEVIDRKMNEISESNTYKEVTDNLVS